MTNLNVDFADKLMVDESYQPPAPESPRPTPLSLCFDHDQWSLPEKEPLSPHFGVVKLRSPQLDQTAPSTPTQQELYMASPLKMLAENEAEDVKTDMEMAAKISPVAEKTGRTAN